jgi:uncharacterized protein (TIGR02996 family)
LVEEGGEIMSLREALEDALVADPDDLAAHRAYADLLMEQGDPRGGFIQAQLAAEGESGPQPRRPLSPRERELWEAHKAEWLRPLIDIVPDLEEDDVQFARGWPDRLYVMGVTLDQARRLSALPGLRLLHELHVTDHQLRRGTTPDAPGPCLRNVRVFRLGFPTRCRGTADYGYGAATVYFLRGMPRLNKLFLFASNLEAHALFTLPTLTRLRVLVYGRGGYYPLAALAANPALRRLRVLSCYPRAMHHGDEPYINLDHLRAVVHSPHLRCLTYLRLRKSDFGNAGCAELVRSGALRRLRALDLADGTITDAGARLLAEGAAGAPLRRLKLSGNALTAAGVALLSERLPAVRLDAEVQHEPGDDQYLYEGDWE